MRKIVYLMLLLVAVTNAQIVSIPDTNFKSKLVSTNCADFNGDGQYDGDVDTNNDGEIQLSEAVAVQKLKINNTTLPSPNAIASLVGIESFVNLTELNAMLNNMTTFNFTLPNLQVLMMSSNNLTSINLSGVTNLVVLDLSQNDLTALVLSSCPNLVSLSCDYNELTALDVTVLPNLSGLSARYNLLNALDLTQSNNLTGLQLDGNQFTPVLTNLVNLQSLGASYMGISSLDVSTNVNLTTLSLNGNLFTELNFPSLPLMATLFCSEMSTLTSVNVNLLPSLTYFNCVNNSQLTTLFMKNGVTSFTTLSLAENFNLEFVCVDDFNVDGIAFNLQTLNILNAIVSSYCTFEPGGDFNTLTGTVLFDVNNDGCDAADVPNPNIKIAINDGTNQGATFTNTVGVYNFYTQAGLFELTPNVENPSWFTFSPTTATVPFVNNNNNVTTQNFCITANGMHPNVEIVIAPIAPARPGFDAIYQIVYKNIGNQAISGTIDFSYDDAVLDFVSATVAPNSVGAGIVNWNYTNLLPFENRSIYVTLNVNSPQEIPAVNINDELNFTATILSSMGDEMLEDNTFVFNQIVIGSYDPNDITCIEGDVVSPSEIGEYLHYVINFENTGTAEAENIVVRTDIDATQFDVNSLQMLNTSHNAYIRQTGNRVEFIFDGIYLETGGHGNVLLKIKSLNNLQEGDSVAKQANIFFDYNFPIETNMANTIFQALSTPGFENDESISVYPNPTNSIVTINCNTTIQSVQLYDVQGRLLQTQIINNQSTTIDFSQQSNGIYFVKVVSDQGIKVEKVVKK